MDADHRIGCLEAIHALAATTEASYVELMGEDVRKEYELLTDCLFNEVSDQRTLPTLVAALGLVRELTDQALDEIDQVTSSRARPDATVAAPNDPSADAISVTGDELLRVATASYELLWMLSVFLAPRSPEARDAFLRGQAELGAVLLRHRAAAMPLAIDAMVGMLDEYLSTAVPDTSSTAS